MKTEHILNEAELKELWNEYHAISDKMRELQKRQMEIDATITRNSCNIVASKFIPLEFGNKIKVTTKKRFFNSGETTEVKVGFFGSFHIDIAHPYTVDNGVSFVKLRLYHVKKDGTRSLKFDDIYCSTIVSIEVTPTTHSLA